LATAFRANNSFQALDLNSSVPSEIYQNITTRAGHVYSVGFGGQPGDAMAR